MSRPKHHADINRLTTWIADDEPHPGAALRLLLVMRELGTRGRSSSQLRSPDDCGGTRVHIQDMGLAVEPFTANDVVRAAEMIALSRAHRSDTTDSYLSLGDGLCLAVTERLNLPVTGGDQLWAELPLTVQFMPFRR